MTSTLVCHPASPAPMIRSLAADVARTPDGGLVCSYHLQGDMARLRIPAGVAGRRDRLWEQTCFEAFIAPSGSAAYLEFNFSPCGQWAAYAFNDYRQPAHGGVLPPAPRIDVKVSAGRLELVAVIARAALPGGDAPLHIGLSAVVESADTVDGERSYWALRHAPGAPDFHRRDNFIIELPAHRPASQGIS